VEPPVLDWLPVGEPEERHPAELDGAAGRPDAHQPGLVGPSDGAAEDGHVVDGERVLDRPVDVRERPAERFDDGTEPVQAVALLGETRGAVTYSPPERSSTATGSPSFQTSSAIRRTVLRFAGSIAGIAEHPHPKSRTGASTFPLSAPGSYSGGRWRDRQPQPDSDRRSHRPEREKR
jgi:hypothetical protein